MKFLFFCIWCFVGFMIGGFIGAIIAACLYFVMWGVAAILAVALTALGGDLE